MKYFSLILLFFITQMAYSQKPQGHYEGALTRNGSVQLISFDFTNNKTTYDIPEIGYMDVIPEKISQNKDTLNIKIFYGDFYCFLNQKQEI